MNNPIALLLFACTSLFGATLAWSSEPEPDSSHSNAAADIRIEGNNTVLEVREVVALKERSDYLRTERRRLQPYEPNYGIFQWTDDDDRALEAHYSFKHLLTRPDCTKRNRAKDESVNQCVAAFASRWEVYFKFTGEFDFYMGTRDSSPVINRRSNPAFHYRKYFKDTNLFGLFSMKYWDVGVQHFSNGQATDAEETDLTGAIVAQTRFARNPNDEYFDSISRGVNFVSLETSFRFGSDRDAADPISGRCDGSEGCYDLWVRVIPWYFTDDNLVTWGPDLGRRHLAAYDLARAVFSWKRCFANCLPDETQRRSWEFTFAWTVGDDLFDTDSFEATFTYPINVGKLTLPIYVQYHNGPMNNFSNYTRSQNAFGIGLRFH